jgi:hypothetical protein
MVNVKIICPNCGRECFGFWIYGISHACSMKCFRKLIADGKISRIPPYAAFAELGILPPKKRAV